MIKPLPSLNALRAFDAVARRLSYRRAADDLNVTPAAVKQLVAKLEDSLGASLVRRQGRGLALTETGEAGRDDLSRAFESLGHAVETMRGVGERHRLIVSVEPSFAAAWLVPRLDRFRRSHPSIDVLIDSSLHIVDLDKGDADIAVRFGVTADASLIAHRLFDEELGVFCSPSLAAQIASPDDLTRVSLLHWDLSQLDWAASTRKWMDWHRWLAHFGVMPDRIGEGLRFSDYNLAIQSAIAGQGVLLGSWPILRGLVEAGLLATPLPQRVVTDIGYDLLITERTRKRPEVGHFVDWMLEEARGGRRRFENGLEARRSR